MRVKLIALTIAAAMLASAAPPILVHGHRGARSVRPENTMPAFEYAIAQGVDVLELDLGVTKDDVLVVSHDSHLNQTICAGPVAGQAIRTLTLKQVRECDCGGSPNPGFPGQTLVPGTRVPTLDQVFALARKHKKVEFNVETKISPGAPDLTPSPERFAELVAAAIRKHKLESRVIVQSFDYRTLRALKQLMPAVRLSALTGPRDSGDYVASAREAGAAIISPHYTSVTPQKVAEAHAAGLQVVPWTPNDEKEWEQMAAAKVDAIITDDPARLIAWLRSR